MVGVRGLTGLEKTRRLRGDAPGRDTGRSRRETGRRRGPAARPSTLSHLSRHRPAPGAHATMISTTRSAHYPAGTSLTRHGIRGGHTHQTGAAQPQDHACQPRMQRTVSRDDPLHEQATTEQLTGAKIQRRYRHEANLTEGEEAHSHHEPELLQRCRRVRVARCCRCHRPCWLTRATRPRRHVGCRPREAIRRATSSSCDRRRRAACELAGHVAGLRDGPRSSSSATTCAAARAPSWVAATARATQAHGHAPFRG